MALAEAHNRMVDADWTPLPLSSVVETVLRPFGDRISEGRFDVGGPELLLAPRTAISFTLALHELATNALKYGSLSVPEGRVRFHWSLDGGPGGFRAECGKATALRSRRRSSEASARVSSYRGSAGNSAAR